MRVVAVAVFVSAITLAQPPAREQLGLTVPMRDGIRLAADLFLPRGNARWPTVLVRTPYNRKGPAMAVTVFLSSAVTPL